jgi:transcriptional regulator with XRE-family HTH domain
MAKPFKLLREKMPRAARLKSEQQAQEMLAEMALDELRQAREKTQQELAKVLDVNQAAVSKLESRIDMYVSTLRKYIEALGGQLEINARFPDGIVRITQFETEPEKKKISAAAAAR